MTKKESRFAVLVGIGLAVSAALFLVAGVPANQLRTGVGEGSGAGQSVRVSSAASTSPSWPADLAGSEYHVRLEMEDGDEGAVLSCTSRCWDRYQGTVRASSVGQCERDGFGGGATVNLSASIVRSVTDEESGEVYEEDISDRFEPQTGWSCVRISDGAVFAERADWEMPLSVQAPVRCTFYFGAASPAGEKDSRFNEEARNEVEVVEPSQRQDVELQVTEAPVIEVQP